MSSDDRVREREPLSLAARGSASARALPASAELFGVQRLVASFLQLLGTHALDSLAALVCLTIVARNWGPAGYGQFALYLTMLSVVVNLDVFRQLFVRERSHAADGREQHLDVLATVGPWLLATVAAALAACLFEPVAVLPFAGSVLLYGAASRHHAALAVRGRVAAAGALRNLPWAAGLLAVAGLSFFVEGPHAWIWPAFGAYLTTWVALRALDAPPAVLGCRNLVGRTRDAFAHYRSQLGNLLGTAFGVGVMHSTDRLLLERSSTPEAFGQYIGHANLALKVNVAGMALSNVLYPVYSRSVAEEGREVAARRFVRIASWVMLGAFAGFLLLVALSEQIVGLVLGPAFLDHSGVFAVMLIGVFVNLFGYVLAPWQRARGDFATQRRAYQIAMLVMVPIGLLLIPPLGALGALLTYLSSRVAELLMIAREVEELPRAVLPWWKIVVAAAMIATLALFATARFSGLEAPA